MFDDFDSFIPIIGQHLINLEKLMIIFRGFWDGKLIDLKKLKKLQTVRLMDLEEAKFDGVLEYKKVKRISWTKKVFSAFLQRI